MHKLSSFTQQKICIKIIRLSVAIVLIVFGKVALCLGISGSPKNNQLLPGSSAYRMQAHLSMINHMAALLYPGSFRHYSNAYQASYNDEYGLSNIVLPPYTKQQVQWMLKEIRPVPAMSVGHYCDRLDSIVGCVDPLRLTVERQHAICVEVAKILPTLPTGTDHPLPVSISEMFVDLNYWQALPTVRSLLPKYTPQHDSDYSWDTSEARLRSAVDKLERAKKAYIAAVHNHVSGISRGSQH